LGYEPEAVKVYGVASETEKRAVKAFLMQKLQGLGNLPPGERQRVMEAVRPLLTEE
jgi:hypothetical protein